MNQSKLEVVKQEMARVNIDILGISELKWTGMGEFISDNHYIYYCGQESLTRNGIAIIVNKRVQNAVLLFIASDFTSITSHAQNWVLFLLSLCLFVLSGVISPLISSSILGSCWPGEFIFQVSPFRYDLNEIPYDYTVEVTNRFKGLNLIDSP